MSITLVLIGMFLGALGNRCWGWEHGDRGVGVFLMCAGIVMCNPDLVLWLPVIAALVWGFRVSGTGESWLAFQNNRNRMKAILRGAAIIPLGAFFTFVTGEWWHVAIAFCFPIIAFIYHFCGKLKVKDPTMYAELLTGAYVVFVTV